MTNSTLFTDKLKTKFWFTTYLSINKINTYY